MKITGFRIAGFHPKIDIHVRLIATALCLIGGPSYSATTWTVDKNTSRMTNVTTVSAYVDSQETVRINMLGDASRSVRPRLWVYCADDQVWPGVDYGFSSVIGGAGAKVMWKIGDGQPAAENNWFLTRSRSLVSPGKNRSGMLQAITASRNTLAFQLTFVGNFQNSLRDPESTYATFSLAGASQAIQQVTTACAANRVVPKGAELLAEKINDGISFAAAAKASITEYYQVNKKFPSNIFQAGLVENRSAVSNDHESAR